MLPSAAYRRRQSNRSIYGQAASCSCDSVLADMLSIRGPDDELKSVKHPISKVFDAVMLEPEMLIYSPELWSCANAFQSKTLAAMLPSEFACIAQKGMRDIAPLLVRVDGHPVNVRGRTIGNFRPEEAVYQLEPDNSHRALIIKRNVIHACTNMLFHRRFIHLLRSP